MDSNFEKNKKLHRYYVGALPIIHAISEKLNLKQLLERYIPTHGNELISSTESLLVIIYNLTLGKHPLYKMKKWTDSIDLRAIGYDTPDQLYFNDDRFGRALDKLSVADKSSLLTELVIPVIKIFKIDLSQLHNDSTSVSCFGNIRGKTKDGLELKRGKSKDHRPDLKQLIYSLTISADGGIPVHFKLYPGNTTDDSTHIETWKFLCKVCNNKNFLYVADSKLCTKKQLSYIASNGGRAVTMMPDTWSEVTTFKNKLRTTKISKYEIYRRIKPGTNDKKEYFSTFKGICKTKAGGYKIHWIYSSEKRDKDFNIRQELLHKAEQELATLSGKLNTRNLKTKESILKKIDITLIKYKINNLLNITINTIQEIDKKQIGKGRPNKNTEYKEIITEIYTLTCQRNKQAISQESNLDGIFPLLSTDTELSTKEVLLAYKYQPHLEKRFSQLKSVHHVAPMLCNNITRIESNMFCFFIALILQSLIEREVKLQMSSQNIDEIEVYPEQRCSKKPTANAIFQLFEFVFSYQIKENEKIVSEYKDDLEKTQALIMKLLNISTSDYWGT